MSRMRLWAPKAMAIPTTPAAASTGAMSIPTSPSTMIVATARMNIRMPPTMTEESVVWRLFSSSCSASSRARSLIYPRTMLGRIRSSTRIAAAAATTMTKSFRNRSRTHSPTPTPKSFRPLVMPAVSDPR